MSNVSALADTASISAAWKAASIYLKGQKGHECFNLIYSITDPGRMTPEDIELFERYDNFARKSGIGTTTTVANTIFPLDTYLKFKLPAFYARYDEEILPQVKTGWGTYFDRMTRRRDIDKKLILDKKGVPLNPLGSLVSKLAKRVKTGLGTKSHYELAIDDEAFELTTYLPERDIGHQRGGPCLSHVSFKIDDAGALRMTAFYRSHFYLQRALGNLLGLARLQAFVAAESKAAIGPLTCIASYAYLESGVGSAPKGAVAKFLMESGI